MVETREATKSEVIDMDDLHTDFLSLRVGEEIPRLQIAQIRKVTGSTAQNNLSGVDYKFVIETKDKKVLTVNSWVLWKKIAAALREAGTIQTDLNIKHTGFEEYSVTAI